MRLLIPIFFVFTSLNLIGNEEIELVQELIAVTQKNLIAQKELLTALIKFQRDRQAFVDEPTSGKLGTELVKSAMIVQKYIEKEHLAHLFASDFLKEIQFFNQLGRQQKP